MGAPLPPVPNVVKVVPQGNSGERIWENVLHWQYSGGAPTPTQCATLATTILNAWIAHITPLQADTTSINAVDVTDLSSNIGGEGSAASTTFGTRGTAELPANASTLITYGATLRYKGGHPRTYLLAGVQGDMQDAQTWKSTYITAVTAGWGAFQTAVNGASAGTVSMVNQVCVRYHGKYLPNGGPPHYYLTTPEAMPLPGGDFLVQAEMASQRRRIGRVRK